MTQIKVNATQLRQICPTAPERVIAELFADAGENKTVIDDILIRTGIIDPRAVATFLSLTIYNSFGLREFNFPIGANSPETFGSSRWMYEQAKRWCDLKLSVEMDGKPSSYEYAFDAMRTSPDGKMRGWGTANMASRYDLYEKALAAFGVPSCESGPEGEDDQC